MWLVSPLFFVSLLGRCLWFGSGLLFCPLACFWRVLYTTCVSGSSFLCIFFNVSTYLPIKKNVFTVFIKNVFSLEMFLKRMAWYLFGYTFCFLFLKNRK